MGAAREPEINHIPIMVTFARSFEDLPLQQKSELGDLSCQSL